MDRRSVLTGLGVSASVLLAGCLHGEGIDDSELDDIDTFLENSVILLGDARARVSEWQVAPGDADVEAIQELADQAGGLQEDYDSDIDPILDRVENTEVERTVQNDEWTVDGGDLREVLEALPPAIELAGAACGGIADADGDPDGIDDETNTTIEDFLAESETPLQDAQALWYEGGL